MEKMIEENAYILFKDHKPNFYDKKQCWLINQLKTQQGIIQKILSKILYRIY